MLCPAPNVLLVQHEIGRRFASFLGLDRMLLLSYSLAVQAALPPLSRQFLFHVQKLPLHQAVSVILTIAGDVGVFVLEQRVEVAAKLIHGAQCAVDEPVDLGVLPVGFAQVGGDLLDSTAALVEALANANVIFVE